jgi:pimeloyl-ACP methyl ester carboxylesterase
VNQASIQIAILDELTRVVKAGNYTGSIGKPKSLVHVGHSLGSDLIAAVVTASPDLVDGIILTGFTFNNPNGMGFLQAFAPRIAKTVDSKWNALDNGYFASSDIYADIEA